MWSIIVLHEQWKDGHVKAGTPTYVMKTESSRNIQSVT